MHVRVIFKRKATNVLDFFYGTVDYLCQEKEGGERRKFMKHDNEL